MFIEKRPSGKNVKFYLVHSFRETSGKVRKIRHYLGKDLSDEQIKQMMPHAERMIALQVERLQTKIFNFTLTPKEMERLNRLANNIKIYHLNQEEWQQFTEEFVYNTNAIEGSTVQQDEVLDILGKKKVEDPDEWETKGVAKAVAYIRTTKQELSLSFILKLHQICFEKTKPFAGAFRTVEVVVTNARGQIIHRGVKVTHLNEALEELVTWYKKNKDKFKPVVLAAIIHNQFEHIHPFQDGNGRVGRLLLNHILLKNEYPPLNIHLTDRAEYYMTLQEYSKEQNLRPTIEFLIKQYKKTLRKLKSK